MMLKMIGFNVSKFENVSVSVRSGNFIVTWLSWLGVVTGCIGLLGGGWMEVTSLFCQVVNNLQS